MGFLICLYCIILSQTVCAIVLPKSGQNTANIEQKLPFTNVNTNRGTNGFPSNQVARNAAFTGNIANTGISKLGNANIGIANIANAVNPSANLPTSKFADVKLAAQNLANNYKGRTNLQGNYGNIGHGLTNLNLNNNVHPELSNQLFRNNLANPVAANLANPLSGNIAKTYNTPNTFKPFTNNFNLANPASFSPSIGNGNIANSNIANPNFAQGLANSNLANAITPGATFAIGGNPFTVLGAGAGLPGNQKIGLNIAADALEVAGSISVAGKMPFYGTVSLSGSLPVDGNGNVNYGC